MIAEPSARGFKPRTHRPVPTAVGNSNLGRPLRLVHTFSLRDWLHYTVPDSMPIQLPSLDLVIVKHEVDIPRPLCVVSHEILVSRRPLLLGVARQHALQTHADALNVVNG